MFEHLVESSSGKQQGRRWSYFAATSAVWVLASTAVIVAGVAGYDGRLNDQFEMIGIVLPAPPPGPPPVGPTRDTTPQGTAPRTDEFTAQQQAPQAIPQASSQPPEIAMIGGGSGNGPVVPGGGPDGVDGGVIGLPGGHLGTGTEPPPPQPPPTPRREEPPPQLQQIRKSGGVFQGTAIRKVTPTYPPMARISRTVGSVVVEVVVDEAGNVISARALSGHPLLREAAVAAARQWKWNATTLSGVPVQVVGTITFNFAL